MLEYKYGKYGVQVKEGSGFVDVRFPADFPLVGSNVKQTNEFCNVFSRNFGCLHSAQHEGLKVPEGFKGVLPLDGVVGKDMAVIRVSANHCSDPLCPVCCFAWAKKTAKRAMNRFEVFELVYGKFFELRHITVSIPVWDYDKSLDFLRKQCLSFVQGVGCVGGLYIYHPKRLNHLSQKWYFSPHFHFLGYVRNGFVDGNMVKLVHDKTGYVLRNLDKRKSVIGTVLYQLSHAGVVKRSKSVSWFGELSFNKRVNPHLKELLYANEVHAKAEKGKCPVCGSKLVHVCRSAVAPLGFDYEAVEESFLLDSVVNWVVVPDVYHQRKRKFSVDEDTKWEEYNCDRGG